MIVSGNLPLKEWSFTLEDNDFKENSLFLLLGFSDEKNKEIFFNDLSFGIQLYDSNNVAVYSYDSKTEPIKFIKTDQPIIKSFIINNLKFGENYSIHCWAINDDEMFADNFSFLIKLPEQPYESWTFDHDKNDWIPPINPPQDGFIYVWNEENNNWVKDSKNI